MSRFSGHLIAWAVCIGVGLLAGEIAGAALFYAEHGGLIYRNQLSPGKESVVESAVRYRQRRPRHSRVKSSTTVRIRNRRPWISVFAFVCDRITQHLEEQPANLLGSLLVSHLQLVAMARSELAPEQRVPFFVLIDEFSNFSTDAFASLLSEARNSPRSSRWLRSTCHR